MAASYRATRAGSLRSPGSTPRTGLSVSSSRLERGSRRTSYSFCCDLTFDGGTEK
jgi:hypothetical protein